MSLSSQTSRVNYTGNGTLSTYSYTFKVFDEDHIRVIVADTDGNETVLTLTTDYTVTGVGETSGGTIVLVDASQDWLTTGNLTTGYTLTIRRQIPHTQETDIRNQGTFYAAVHEDEFDKLVMADQQQQDELDRSLKLGETVDPNDFDATIPSSIVGSASTVIGTNADGDGIAVGPTFDEVSNAQGYALAASASADAAATSETNAATSETNAATSETNAASSESAAATSETNAASSASAAATSESNAATSETNAATSESNAATSETNAANSASAAASSAISADASATSAGAALGDTITYTGLAQAAATSASASAASAYYRWGGTGGGTANAQTMTPSPSLSSYSTGIRYAFIAGATNTGACTLNISGLGAKTLKTLDGSTDLTAGQITSGSLVSVSYDGTNFRVHEVVAITDASLTNAKLADMAQATIKGRASGAGTGVPTDLTASQIRTITSQGMVLIQTQTASSSATIDFTTGISSTYDQYVLVISDVLSATNAVEAWIRVSTDGGSTWKSGASDYAYVSLNVYSASNAASAFKASADTKIILQGAVASSAPNSFTSTVKFFAPSNSSRAKIFQLDTCHYASDGNFYRTAGTGSYVGSTTAINGIRFLMSSGNISSGTFSLYGIMK